MVLSLSITMKRFHFHKFRIIFPIIGLFTFLLTYYLWIYNPKVDVRDRIIIQNSVKKNILNNDRLPIYKYGSASHVACIQPDLDVRMLNLEKFALNDEALVCAEEKNWVQITGFEAVISWSAKKLYGKIACTFTELIRINDDEVKFGQSTTTSETFIFLKSDFYDVSCVSEGGKKWKNTLAGIRRDDALHMNKGWEFLPPYAVKHNVFMLGFDSLSRITFIKLLPKTYRFITEVLKTNVLEGYNIVGDGTPQALIPILTGKTELELPETRRRLGKEANFVDVYPFIWKDFENSGYVTLFAEDEPQIGTFNYRFRGFNNSPTDHYMRPFYTHVYPTYNRHPNYCLGSTPRHKVFLQYLTDFFDVYESKPKFAFAMNTELSHDDQTLISIADDDIVNSLSYLHGRGHFDNTIFILFSDHGSRFSTTRATQQGKQEERLPFFSVYLPPKFQELYPSAADNVRVNTRRLTSPFDIYPTLKDLIKFSGAKLGDVRERGISLFSEVPTSRTCRDAFIEPHWCACLAWEPLSTTDEKALEAAEALVHYINSYVASQCSVCQVLELVSVAWASLLLPNQDLIKFKQTFDYDGFLPDFSDRTAIAEEVYQVSITAGPTKEHFHTSNEFPMFEASLTYNIKQDTFSVKIDDISRVNKYGDQPHCIMKSHPHLRKFCYCLQPPVLLN